MAGEGEGMSIQEIRLTKSDITLERLNEPCECDDGPVNTVVLIDYRSAGMKVVLGKYCYGCAEETAKRIQDGLPDEEGAWPGRRRGNGTNKQRKRLG